MLESARKSMDELLEKLLKFDRGIGRHSGASHLIERRQTRRFDQRPSRGTPNPDEG
jgi:hypothetical protein